MPICAKCGQENPDVARFCLACGSPLIAAVPAAEERKLITVLFCDIVGSTAKAEQMDPEDVRARLAPYYVRLRAELVRFGGTVEKFIGDAVVALFGAPVAHEDDPERAVRAAFAVRRAIEDLNEQDEWLDLKIRVGVNTGEALVVLGAAASEGEGMASGDVMNTAARLQSAAAVDGILVGELTYQATRETIAYSAAEPIAAKGKSEPVTVWEALEVREAPARRRTDQGAFVGRAQELEDLLAFWRQAAGDGIPGLATVVGAPGIGKSRFLAEFAAQAEVIGDVHWGRCLPYGEGITYWPVTEILKSAAGILQSDDAGEVAAKLDGFLDRLATDDADELRTMAATVSNLFGAPVTPRGTYSATEIAQAELHWGFRRIVHLLAQARPLALVFEDLHWAEPTLLELLRYLVSSDEDVPLVVIGSGRPELVDIDPQLVGQTERRRTFMLEPLDTEAGIALLAELLGHPELATEPAAVPLLRNAGGNPLFLEETVRMLAEAGAVDASGWHLEGDGDAIPVPTSLQGLIGSRLDQLPLPAKQVAQHASVVGAVFWEGAVAHLQNGGSNGELPAHLTMLERRDLVHGRDESTVEGEREYTFKHILIRDVAYGQLPKGKRTSLHLRFAHWVEALLGSEEDFVEIVAWHLEQSCRLAGEIARSPVRPPILEAAAALTRAAEKAERREGMREADRFYERALELVGDEHLEQRVELRVRRARPLAALGKLKESIAILTEAIEEAGVANRPDLRCSGLVLLANIALRQGNATEARPHLAEANTIAERLGDRALQIRVAFALSTLKGEFEGKFEEALEDLSRAVALAEEIDERALRVEGHLRMAFLYLFSVGDLPAAEQQLERCLALATALGSRRDEARATHLLGRIKCYRGDLAEAERLGLQAQAWLDMTGETFFQVQNSIALAQCALACGDAALADEHLCEILPLALEEGGWLVPEVYRLLAEARVAQDRVSDAEELAEFAGRKMPEDHPYIPAAALLAEATVAAAKGERDIVRDRYERALFILEETKLAIDLCLARTSFARALEALGDTEAARSQLELVVDDCVRMGATGLAADAERLLARLGSGAGSAGPTAA